MSKSPRTRRGESRQRARRRGRARRRWRGDSRPGGFRRVLGRQDQGDCRKVPREAGSCTVKPSEKDGVDFAILKMDHVEGASVWGQVAKPTGSH